MPFGQKSDLKSGVVVDFDQIYNEARRLNVGGRSQMSKGKLQRAVDAKKR